MTTEHRQALIDYLMNHRGFVSGEQLSAVLGVSTKTITRNVKQVNAQHPNEPIIEAQRGRGYRINRQHYLVTTDRDSNAGRPTETNRMTSMGRRDAVLRQLLVASPHSYRIDAVWGKFYVSDSTISSDIKILRSMLHQYHLIRYQDPAQHAASVPSHCEPQL